MKNIVVLVLGGGRGTRLYPLTKFRSKPAVPIAGKYRLIDIPLSNCLNSGLEKIYVITQFNSASLHHHIHSYAFDNFSHGFVEILAAQQTNEAAQWYQGTADAVRQNFPLIEQRNIDYVLILSGDQLYRMDFKKMLETHQKANADVTIAAVPVLREQAPELGIMRLDDTGRVTGFLEKPQSEQELNFVRTSAEFIDQTGIPSHGREYLASMGIYLFNRHTLLEALEKTDYRDFGKEVFPASIRTRRVQVHLFDGYWEDIGTIRAFYEANLAMTDKNPPFELWTPGSPTYTKALFLPSSQIEGAQVHRSLIADGCIIEEGAVIEHSIIGVRCRIGKNCQIRNSILMGNDFLPDESERQKDETDGLLPLKIGDGTIIDGAIIDKNCRIGANVQITNQRGIEETPEGEFGMIRGGVICIVKNTMIPDGWNLENKLSAILASKE